MSARFLTTAALLLGLAMGGNTVAQQVGVNGNTTGGDHFLCDGRAKPCAVRILSVIWEDSHCSVVIDHEVLYVDPKARDVEILWTVSPRARHEMQSDSIELKDASRYDNFDQRYPIFEHHDPMRPMHRFHWRTHNREHAEGNTYPYQIVLYDAANGHRRCVIDPAIVSPGRP
jgi:hypothetical protein